MVLLEIEKYRKKLVAKKTRAAKSKEIKETNNKEYVVVDYPQDGEKLLPYQYTIRIGSNKGASVEISIDNQLWKPCRESQGYFWYDWTSIPKGEHSLIARKKLSTGKYKKSKIIKCIAVPLLPTE